jgi:acetyl-CoA acetyltransferase
MVAPLFPGFDALAALQARSCLEAGVVTERAMAEVASRSRRDARNNPVAYLKGDESAD